MKDEKSKLPINTWDQVGYGGVFITYQKAEPRACMCSKTQVIRPGLMTDPNAAWYDHGNKTFSGKMSVSVPAAKAWASKKYGIKKWKRNRMGDWIDADAKLLPLRPRD